MPTYSQPTPFGPSMNHLHPNLAWADLPEKHPARPQLDTEQEFYAILHVSFLKGEALPWPDATHKPLRSHMPEQVAHDV